VSFRKRAGTAAGRIRAIYRVEFLAEGRQQTARRIDEPGGVPYKPRQSRARNRNCVRKLCLTNKLQKTRVLRAAEKSRETNLPAEQIGAQAPAWFSRSYGDQGRP